MHPQFWAEDGAVFFQQQFVLGYWRSIPNAYFGYIHLIPRTISFVSSFLPIASIPLAFSVCSLAIQTACCSIFFWPCFRPLISSDSLRATCCLIMASAPYTGGELIATVCNLQIFVSVLSLLLLAIDVNKTSNWRLELVFALVQAFTALTAPIALLFVPILIWQIVARAGWFKLRPLLHLVSLCVQAWFMRTFAVARPHFRFDATFLSALSSGLTRCILEPMTGSAFLTHTSPEALLTEMTVTLILLIIVATYVAVRLNLAQLRWFLCAGYFGLGSLVMALSGRGFAKDFLSLDGIRHFGGSRYFFPGACMFIFCLAFALQTAFAKLHPRICAGILLLCFSGGILQNFRSEPGLVDLNWKKNALLVERWVDARRQHQRAEAISVPINPPGWVIALPEQK